MLKQLLRIAIYLLVTTSTFPVRAGTYDDFLAAIQRDDASTVSELLKRGLDPNTRGPGGQPALTLALQKESPKVTRVLLDAPGADLDLANEHGETPLMLASLKGAVDIARQLLDRGAKVDRTGWAPLHYAASGPSVAMLKLLLDRGAAVDAPSPNETTALMMAARYGSEDAVALLLERGADPKRRNEKGLGCADFARLAGREALATRLGALQK